MALPGRFTLCSLFEAARELGPREAILQDNGFRTFRSSYQELYRGSLAVAGLLQQRGLGQGDRVVLWGKNSVAWVQAFWGCLLAGVVAVPLDARSSGRWVEQVRREVGAGLVLDEPGADAELVSGPRLHFSELGAGAPARDIQPARVAPHDVAEIVYTSGTTGTPRGVVYRHRNIMANLAPLAREIGRYRKWTRLVQPIRILDLLPLSHMYGQWLGIFIPLLLEGSVLFTSELAPRAILRALPRHRVSVLVAVPHLLGALEREIRRRFGPPPRCRLSGWPGVAERWWRSRRLHRALGWKFWALLTGGARLEPSSESFWKSLGYALLQGYGMTEVSPILAVNHPLRARTGSIGKALSGNQVKIAPDGEILVRVEALPEYLEQGTIRQRELQDGWFHTGDMGEIDSQGRLYFRGRKKEMIVTAAGLNVYPEDVEAVLEQQSGVRAAAVVARSGPSGEGVHAVLILERPQADPAALVARANRLLEPHQRIRSWSLWPEADFPRTLSTGKVQRIRVAERVAHSGPVLRRPQSSRLEAILAAVGGRSDEIKPGTELEAELGFSSLERMELLSRLESELGVELDEVSFSACRTVAEVEALLRRASGRAAAPETPRPQAGPRLVQAPPLPPPRAGLWNLRPPVSWLRRLFHFLLVRPLVRRYLPLQIEGLEHLGRVPRPLVLAANHLSHLDTAVLFTALPPAWRGRLAPAMSQQFFRPWFEERGSLWRRVPSGFLYLLARVLFAAYPISQHASGVRSALGQTGALLERGYVPLIFPEGKRSPDGHLQPFRSGVGLMALRLEVPVLPVYLEGLFEVLPIHARWPRSGGVRVRFGAALSPLEDPHATTRAVEAAVRALAATPSQG